MTTQQIAQTGLRSLVLAALVLLMALLMALLSFYAAPVAFGQAETPPAPLAAGGGYALLYASAEGPAVRAAAAQQASAPTVSAAGGGYLLLLPAAVEGTGTPCCCMHLPCILK